MNQQNVNVPTAAIADETNTNRNKEHLLLVPIGILFQTMFSLLVILFVIKFYA